jgi:hypothetical protein
VVADPTGDLPSARAEAAVIAGPSTPLLIGAQATPGAFRAALARDRPRVLHLACHAHYDWDNAAGSRLRLHGGDIGMDEMLDALAGGGAETAGHRQAPVQGSPRATARAARPSATDGGPSIRHLRPDRKPGV